MKAADPTAERIDSLAARWVARRDAGLSAPEQAEFAAWLRADARHPAALARFEATWTAIGRPRRTGASPGLTRELAGLRRRRRTRLLGAAAAAAVMLVAAGLLWSPRAGPPTVATEGQIVISMPEQRTLPDGSVVELKAGAQIGIDYTTALRRVRLLRGEAHFAVTKNPNRPFIVDAAGVALRAVGTAFAVELDRSSVGLLVTEGRVAVDRAPDRNEAPTSTSSPAAPLGFVEAGQQVDIIAAAASSAPLQVRTIAADELSERLAWRVRRAEFSGAPLSEVVALLNRHTREQFVIEDPELARVPLSGLFRLDDIPAFVRLLETGFGVQVEARGDHKFILRRSRL